MTRTQADQTETPSVDVASFRQRLLDGLTASIEQNGYRNTTVADIVRLARTSRRTFYEHFSSKETCFVALLTDANAEMIRQIAASVDQSAPWATQVRQAVEAWIGCAESQQCLTLSWIRDVPSLGAAARELQREGMAAFVTMILALCDTDEWRSSGAGQPSRQLLVMLLGGLRELIATTVEDGGQVGDITEIAVQASIAILGARTSSPLPGSP
ncbi:TetR/AcrR family transcriptional regulator [Actinocrispum wychmicini]|uniref:TetR/AcrR family transcriptional regulator n=1 Tax=Actinocrispum wychmicini TaxID=1213861 RepID=UPI001FB7D081|nr:TetR/AcrR family transcriptional regulator [Actinocrispum wychmicini]